MDSQRISFYKNISLALVFLMGGCILIGDISLNLSLDFRAVQWIIFINIAFLAALSLDKIELIKTQRKIILYLLLIVAYLSLIAIILYSGDYTYTMFKTYVKNVVLGLLCFIVISNRKFSLIRLNNFLIYLAFVLSIFSVILYFGFLLGIISLEMVNLSFLSEPQYYNKGSIFGYLNTADEFYKYGTLPRSQSYWTEASYFAQFLAIPLFLSLKKYLLKKNLFNLMIMTTIVIAYLLTFSVANFLGIAVAFAIYFLFKKPKSRIKKEMFGKIINFSIVILLCFSIYFFFQITTKPIRENVFTKDSYAYLATRVDRVILTLKMTEDHPLGNLSFLKSDYYRGNVSSLGHLLIFGGIPLIILILILTFRFYASLFRVFKKSQYSLIYIGSIAYFIPFNWFGAYLGIYFIFHLALFTTFIKYDYAGKKII